MNTKFIIRLYRDGEEKSIVGLLKSAFSVWDIKENSLDYWRWKYLDTPMGTDIVVAESERGIIAVSHNILLNIKVGDAMMLSQFSCDVTTHNDYRGMGVFSGMVEYVEKLRSDKQVRLGYGISSNPVVIKEWGKRGRFSFPHLTSIMVRIKDVDLHLKMRPMENSEFIRAGFKALSSLHRIRRTLKGQARRENDLNLRSITRFHDDNDVFFSLVQKDYDFLPEKSSFFLNWRYCDSRGGKFIVKQAVEGGAVLGYIAYQLVKTDEYPEGFIFDLLALPGRVDVIGALLEDACKFFDDSKVNVIYYLVVKEHNYQAISVNHGFLDSRRSLYITFQVIDASYEFEALRGSPSNRVYFSYCDML